MDTLRRARQVAFVAIAALAIVLSANAPSEARGGGGHGGFGGGHAGEAFGHGFDGHHDIDGHHDFDGHHDIDGHHDFDGHHDSDGHHDFDRFGHGRFLFGFGGSERGDLPGDMDAGTGFVTRARRGNSPACSATSILAGPCAVLRELH